MLPEVECATGLWLWIPFGVVVAIVAMELFLWYGLKKGTITITNPAAVRLGMLMMHVAGAVGVLILAVNKMACN